MQEPTQALKPRAQWMKDTPPFTADAEADATYSAACSWMFGTTDPDSNRSSSNTSPATLALRSQFAALQGQLRERDMARPPVSHISFAELPLQGSKLAS